jgi:hypothetical protein
MLKSLVRSVAPLAVLLAISGAQGCSDNSGLVDVGNGGNSGTGGTSAGTSDGGAMGTGGATANTGGTVSATGGTNASTGGIGVGGTPATGGVGGTPATGGVGGTPATGGVGGTAATGGAGGTPATGGVGGTPATGGQGGIGFAMCQPGAQCSASAMCTGICQVSQGLSGSRDCTCVNGKLLCGQCQAAACTPGLSCQGFPTNGYATNGATVDNCAGMTHQTDCCGARKVFGINHGERTKLCAAEAICRTQYMQNASCTNTTITADTGDTSNKIDNIRVRCNPAVLGSCECQTFVCNSDACRPGSRPVGSCGG